MDTLHNKFRKCTPRQGVHHGAPSCTSAHKAHTPAHAFHTPRPDPASTHPPLRERRELRTHGHATAKPGALAKRHRAHEAPNGPAASSQPALIARPPQEAPRRRPTPARQPGAATTKAANLPRQPC